MKLSKLYSDNPLFKTIEFRPGLNIVAGLQSTELADHSFNGIGKSTSLNLIHLMFGTRFDSSIPSDKNLKQFLSSYGRFHLDFYVDDVLYTISKNFSEACCYINNDKVTQTDLPKKLNNIFKINTKIDFNFKALFNMFARRNLPDRTYYSGALTQQGQPLTDYRQALYNLTLLGIDNTLIKLNKEISDNLKELKKIESTLKNQKLTINDSDLLDLKDELEKRLSQKDSFIIAKNYDELKSQADSLTQSMNEIRNNIFHNEREIRKKTSVILSSKNDLVNVDRVSQIYKEAQFFFPDIIEKKLKDAEAFHIKMQSTRKERLQDQINYLTEENNTLEKKLSTLENQRDHILKDLDTKGALEEYNSLVERIRTLESDIAELSSYQTVLVQFEKDKADMELKKAQIKSDSVKYLEDNEEKIQFISLTFRNLVKRFYHDHGGSLSITTTKDAQYLYNIVPHINKDGSQGINEVKIFCYDMLLAKLNPNLLNFLAHDSCIFNGVDPRQLATMFKIVIEEVQNNDLQYFVNINQNTYEHLIKGDMLPDDEQILLPEDKQLINDSLVLRLYDGSPEHTLLGKSFG